MSVRYLKIKVTSLAAEIKLIRKEETRVKPSRQTRRSLNRQLKSNDLTAAQRARIERNLRRSLERAQQVNSDPYDVFWGLRNHRQYLSRLSRDAQLAYAFLRGKSYRTVERDAKSPIDVSAVLANVKRFGDSSTTLGDVESWRDAA